MYTQTAIVSLCDVVLCIQQMGHHAVPWNGEEDEGRLHPGYRPLPFICI